MLSKIIFRKGFLSFLCFNTFVACNFVTSIDYSDFHRYCRYNVQVYVYAAITIAMIGRVDFINYSVGRFYVVFNFYLHTRSRDIPPTVRPAIDDTRHRRLVHGVLIFDFWRTCAYVSRCAPSRGRKSNGRVLFAVGRSGMNNIHFLVATAAAASVYIYAVFILPPIERTMLVNISTPTAFASSEKRSRRKTNHRDPVVNTKVPPPLRPHQTARRRPTTRARIPRKYRAVSFFFPFRRHRRTGDVPGFFKWRILLYATSRRVERIGARVSRNNNEYARLKRHSTV